jgi:hypothetical protein
MPEIARFYGIIITMYFDDQHLPHFHARYTAYRASFTIDPPALYAGAMPRRQQNMILGWAEIHQEELMENWHSARLGQPMRKIGGLG